MSEKNTENSHILSRISQAFVNNYKATIILIIGIGIAGIWGIFSNQRQDFPSIPVNIVRVQATYIGATADDIEQDVLIPLEQSIDNVEGISEIRSTAQDNIGFITAEVEDFSAVDTAAEDITAAVSSTALPDAVETYTEKIDAVGPSIVLGLTSEKLNKKELLEQSQTIARELESASDEVSTIEITPEDTFEVVVTIDDEKLSDAGLSLQDVQSAIESTLVRIPGGSITSDETGDRSIQVTSTVDSLEDIANIRVTQSVQIAAPGFGEPQSALISEIADVRRVPKNTEVLTLAGYTDSEGKITSGDVVYLSIIKKDDGDVITLSTEVNEAIDDINTTLGEQSIELVTLYDSAPSVADQISSLVNNAFVGLILILIVLLFFINLRTAILVAFTIPLAFAITLFALPYLGFTINILTLFGMILALGVLVDNAIVIAEGMVERIEHGQKKLDAIQETVRDIGPAVSSATLTTIVAFIPFALMGGIIGEFLKFIPYTVITILIASFCLAVFITPVLARFTLKEQTRAQRRTRTLPLWQKILIVPAIVFYGQKCIDALEDAYQRVGKRILKNTWSKIAVLVITCGALFMSFGAVAPTLSFEQFPSDDGELINISIDFPAGVPFAEQQRAYERMANESLELPYFKSYYVNRNQLFILFTAPEEREDGMTIYEIFDAYDERVKDIAEEYATQNVDIRYEPQQPGPPSSHYDTTIEIVSDDGEVLEHATADIAQFASELGVEKIANSTVDGLTPSIQVTFDEDALEDKNVNPLIASQTMNTVFSQKTVGSTVGQNNISEDVVIAYADSAKNSIDDLRELEIPTTTGSTVVLDDIATVEEVQQLESISRINGKRTATTQFIAGEDYSPEVITETDGDTTIERELSLQESLDRYLSEEKLEELELSSDEVQFGGAYEEDAENFNNLIIVTILAMLMVYIILVALFRSYGQPALVMFTIPLALIGVFPALSLVGSSVNMISGLGIVALIGVVVNDAIVFIDYLNRYRKNNPEQSLEQQLVETGRARFKPILSTSITTIGGILPLTLTDPFWQGLGTSMISGLICATIGTLLVIPVVISLIDSIKRRTLRRFTKRS